MPYYSVASECGTAYFLFSCVYLETKLTKFQPLEATQMKFLRHLLRITNQIKKRINVLGKKGTQNIVKEIKQQAYQKKWLQHVQRMDTNRILKQALQYKPRTKEHRTTEEEMEGPTSSCGLWTMKHA
jgi:hypothetical protein